MSTVCSTKINLINIFIMFKGFGFLIFGSAQHVGLSAISDWIFTECRLSVLQNFIKSAF